MTALTISGTNANLRAEDWSEKLGKLPNPQQEQISKWFNEAKDLARVGELIKARERYGQILEILPDHLPALQNSDNLDKRLHLINQQTAPLTALIAQNHATARTYADRGLLYVNRGDFSRGFSDLSKAVEMNKLDIDIATDRAEAYLMANRLKEATEFSRQIISLHPRHTKAYEIRAWAELLQGNSTAAYKDAFSSLVEIPDLTRKYFSAEQVGYRVLAGYFALRHSYTRDKANEWLQQWRTYLDKKAWPDAMALYFLGTLDLHESFAVTEKLREKDHSKAFAEAKVFAALEAHLAGNTEAYTQSIRKFSNLTYTAGYVLPWVIKSRLDTDRHKW